MAGNSRSEGNGQTTDPGVSASLLLKKGSFPNATTQSNFAERTWATSVRQRLLCDTWFYELVAISISVACLIAIGVILSEFDQRPAPQLKYGLTLNAIISILATGSKAGLIFAVASCISQLKWYWFQKDEHPLRDLQTFDDASRGFSGAIVMLVAFWGQSLASIGAVITILAVAFDPFVQQLLAYPVRPVPRNLSSASTQQAAIFGVSGDDIATANSFVSAINAGIWTDSSQFARNPICATGNCTWPVFKSVGWCSKCEDISPSVSVSGCNFTIDRTYYSHNHSHNHNGYDVRREVPCGLDLDRGPAVDLSFWYSAISYHAPNYTVASTVVPDEVIWAVHGIDSEEVDFPIQKHLRLGVTFNEVENPLSVFVHTSLKLVEEHDPSKGLLVSRAEQCVLSLCERSYNLNVQSGVPSSTVLSKNWGAMGYWDLRLNKNISSSDVHRVESSDGGDVVYMFWTANPGAMEGASFNWDPDASLYIDPVHSAFTIDSSWYDSIAQRIQGNVSTGWGLNGRVATDLNGDLISHSGWRKEDSMIYSSDIVEAISTKGLSSVIESIAASLTRLGLDQSTAMVSGTVGMSEVYIHVRWKWLILPCLLELGGIGFLIITMLVSRYRQVSTWKSSIYAFLYHGLEREVLYGHPIEDTVSGMQQRGRLMTVRLKMPDDGGRRALRKQSQTVIR